jgi:hypothetical protein
MKDLDLVEEDKDACASTTVAWCRPLDQPLSEEEAALQSALELVLACDDSRSWNDRTQNAFNSVRKAVMHVPVEVLDGYAEHAEEVFSFLLHVYATRSMNRNLIVSTLQKLVAGLKWKEAATSKKMSGIVRSIAMELGVAGPECLGSLASLGADKVAQFLEVFDVRLETVSKALSNEAPIQSFATEIQQQGLWRWAYTAIVLLLVLWGCCPNAAATCASYACPDSYRLKSNATAITCLESRCAAATDLQRCCEPLATCSSLPCPKWYRSKIDAQHVRCQNKSCSVEADLDRCCEFAGMDPLLKTVESMQAFLANVLPCPSCPREHGVGILASL